MDSLAKNSLLSLPEQTIQHLRIILPLVWLASSSYCLTKTTLYLSAGRGVGKIKHIIFSPIRLLANLLLAFLVVRCCWAAGECAYEVLDTYTPFLLEGLESLGTYWREAQVVGWAVIVQNSIVLAVPHLREALDCLQRNWVLGGCVVAVVHRSLEALLVRKHRLIEVRQSKCNQCISKGPVEETN